MTTTHKTLRGPRGAIILVTERGLERDPKLGSKIDKAIIPGLQGGPHNATTAGIAVALEEAAQPSFREYSRQTRRNADALVESMISGGLKLIGGGTENHLMVVDLTPYSDGLGTQVAYALDVAGIYTNRNTIPNEPVSPFYPSGLRLGTPLVTTRGMREVEMDQIGQWIVQVVEHVKDEKLPTIRQERALFIRDFRSKVDDDEYLLQIRGNVKALATQFPLFQEV